MEPADMRNLLRLVQCPVCNQYMQSTIYQCCNGHAVCDKCKPKLEKCPTCPEKSMEIRNLALENIAKKLCYPCKFKDMGCKDLIFLPDRLDHELSCYFKIYTCFLPTYDFQMCNFSSPLYKLKDHLLQWHFDCTSVQENVVAFNKRLNLEHMFCWKSVIIAYKEIFFCIITSIQKELFGFVQHIGPPKETEKYMSEIAISTNNGRKCAVFRLPVRNITINETDIFTSCYSLPLMRDATKWLMKDYDSLLIRTKIKLSRKLQSRQGTNSTISSMLHNRITYISKTDTDRHSHGAQASEKSTDRKFNISPKDHAVLEVKTFPVLFSTNGAIPKIGAAGTSRKMPLNDKKIKNSTGYEDESHSDSDEGPSKSVIAKTMRSTCVDNFDVDEQTDSSSCADNFDVDEEAEFSSCYINFDVDEQTESETTNSETSTECDTQSNGGDSAASHTASSKSESGNVAISSDINETSLMNRSKSSYVRDTLTYAQAVKSTALEGRQT